MTEIRPSQSLIAAISQFSDARRTEAPGGNSAPRPERASVDARQQTARPSGAEAVPERTVTAPREQQRVQTSSPRQLDAARDNVRRATEVNPFRREAPTVRPGQRDQLPGQIVNILV